MITAIFLALALVISLTGCMGNTVDVTVGIKNATGYELKWVVFNIPPSSGTYSPMKNIITGEGEPLQPGESCEVAISFVDKDFGNDGFALIGLEDDGSSDSLNAAMGPVMLERGANLFTITHNGEHFAITSGFTDDTETDESGRGDLIDDEAVDEASGEGRGDLTDDEAVDEASGEGRGDLLDNEEFFTLYADFSAGSVDMQPTEKNIPLPPREDMPPSNALVAFYLADELSEWTGLDFTLNDVSLGEDSITVDWSADSTLIAGLDDREQKEDFHFFDAVSLNWFLMDSLAQTLKHNLQVTTVFYCSDGNPITFTNPEDMAAQGLPELPVDQPYEGSAFFVSHADAQG